MDGYIDFALQPKCKITVKGTRKSVTIEAVIDTGFSGFLCIPVSIAIQIGLELFGQETVILADGSKKRQLTFIGTALLENKEIPIEISLTNADEALLGVGLLKNKKLEIDFPAKIVSIKNV